VNVRPETSHGGGHPALVGSEGELDSVSIAVDVRLLEQLLEALAGLPFPVNPQIHHNDTRHATTVEFPAYASRLAEIRRAVAGRGFDPASVSARSMLEQIQSR